VLKQVEDDVLRQQIEQYNETVSRYQLYQQQQQLQQLQQLQHYHHHQQGVSDPASERHQSAPADVVQALLDISTLPSSTSQPHSQQ